MSSNKEKSSDLLPLNPKKLQGKWIVLSDEHVIESGEDIEMLIKKARVKYPQRHSFSQEFHCKECFFSN